MSIRRRFSATPQPRLLAVTHPTTSWTALYVCHSIFLCLSCFLIHRLHNAKKILGDTTAQAPSCHSSYDNLDSDEERGTPLIIVFFSHWQCFAWCCALDYESFLTAQQLLIFYFLVTCKPTRDLTRNITLSGHRESIAYKPSHGVV